MTTDAPYYRQVFSAPLEDVIRAKAQAARAGMSFSAWLREAMVEKAKRENGERGVTVSGQNVRRVASTPGRVVREEGASSGVGRVGAVSSSELELQRERARELAQRSGRCTADVSKGVRCRLCGKIH